MPIHLRDAHYAGAKRLGHGKGYVYAHDELDGVADEPDVARRLVIEGAGQVLDEGAAECDVDELLPTADAEQGHALARQEHQLKTG